MSLASGTYFSTKFQARGAAFADFDRDGDVDVAVVTLKGRALLLRNDTVRTNHWIRLELEGAGILRGGAFTPDGRTALVTLERSKNLLPNVAVGEGWSMTYGLAVVSRTQGGTGPSANGWEARQVLIDGLTTGNADPHDVAITPDGKLAFVACLAADRILVLDVGKLLSTVRSTPPYDLAHRLDLANRFLVATIPTGPGPRALALSRGGDRLFVALSFAESVEVIDTRSFSVVATHRLAPPRNEPPARHGQRLFHNARQSFEMRLACSSCHPEGHHDGLTYDLASDGLGKNRVRIKTLLGSSGTEPFKWSGMNAGYYAQCGPRAARLIMRAEGFSPGDLDALVSYLRSLGLPPNPFASPDGSLTHAQERGRVLFERERRNDGKPIGQRDRCSFCHPGPRFTNRRTFDVSTKGSSDTTGVIDTPQLENLFMTRPFLHDGRCATLEEVFTLENPADKHGVANDLGKDELNDLVEFMKTLGPRRAPRSVTGAGTKAHPSSPRGEN